MPMEEVEEEESFCRLKKTYKGWLHSLLVKECVSFVTSSINGDCMLVQSHFIAELKKN